jgi:hypothetical protein
VKQVQVNGGRPEKPVRTTSGFSVDQGRSFPFCTLRNGEQAGRGGVGPSDIRLGNSTAGGRIRVQVRIVGREAGDA